MDIYSLRKRANIDIKITDYSQVVIYEDHRSIINVLYFLKLNQQAKFPINIFLFDDHDDAVNPSPATLKEITALNETEPSLRDIWSFTEFSLRGMDDDWVKAGMELGLINNVFLFNSDRSSILFQEKYETQRYGIKKIYNLGDVWSVIGYRGYLNDIRLKRDYSELWSDMGWIQQGDTMQYNLESKIDFIVDIDLDCFTTDILGKTVAIPEENLINKFRESCKPDYHFYYNSEDFVKMLIKKSVLTTICFENNCCGGIRESNKIFDTIDYILFDNQIGQ